MHRPSFKIYFFCSLQKTIRNTNLQTNRRCNAVQWWIVTVFVTWERSQRKIRKFLLPILTNRWSALASIGLYRKPQKQRGSMGTECCFCCIYFWMRKPMMNWHLPQLQRNYFWAKSCRAFVQLWHWILVTTGCYGGLRMFNCNICLNLQRGLSQNPRESCKLYHQQNHFVLIFI